MTNLVILEPVEAVGAEDKPVLSGRALDEGDGDAQPALPEELVGGSPCSSLLPLRGTIKPNEVRVVGVHVR